MRVEEGATMGRWGRIHAGRAVSARTLLIACCAAALALVALPTGAAADHRVPPPSCPPEITLAGIERAPGGVIFTGRVTAVTPEIGRVRLDVIDWYHRGPVPRLARGVHPATLGVMLGPRLTLAGEAIPPAMPQVGSWFLVAGTWQGPPRDASVTCGVLANVNYPAGAAWLDEAAARHAAFPPTRTTAAVAPLPLDAPWFLLGLVVVVLLLAAAAVETIADARDPLPAV